MKRHRIAKPSYDLRLLRFLDERMQKGIKQVREKELKAWARTNRMSYTTLHITLESLIPSYIIRTAKKVNGHLAVFYGLSDSFRDWILQDLRKFAIELKKIDLLEEKKKPAILQLLILRTMQKFADFVPFYIDFAMRNPKTTEDDLETLWHYCLYSWLIPTIGVCLRNRKSAKETGILKEMATGYEEYLRSDYYESLKKKFHLLSQTLNKQTIRP